MACCGLLTIISCLLVSSGSGNTLQAQMVGSSGLSYEEVPYPRFMLYTGLTGNGWPLVEPLVPAGQCPVTGAQCRYNSDCAGALCSASAPNPTSPDNPLRTDVVAQFARFPLIVMPPTPSNDNRTELLSAIRTDNPGTHIMAYTIPTAGDCAVHYSPDDESFWLHTWETIASIEPNPDPVDECDYTGPGRLWLQNGEVASSDDASYGINVNFAYRTDHGDGTYSYPMSEALATMFFDDLYVPGRLDGVFLDVFCSGIQWINNGLSSKIDYARAGYADAASFYSGWTAGTLAFTTKLRELIDANGGSDFPIVGNCGTAATTMQSITNGWMRENFPYQNGGTWYSNMYRWPTGGYLFDDASFRTPSINVITMYNTQYWLPYSTTALRKERFTLGSAALGNGYAVMTDSHTWPDNSPMHEWWYDEYAVDLPTGQSTSDAMKTGWLGFPKGDAYQMITAPATPDLIPAGTFEGGFNGWTTWADPATGSTFTWESGAGPDGNDAVRINVATASSDDWKATLASPTTAGSTFTMSAGVEYSVTFWAKADHQRPLSVSIRQGANTTVSQDLPVTTEWKQYQVTFTDASTHTGQSISLNFAADVGGVWVTNIHVNQGVTSVYRRDFDNGIVLVNPGQQAQTVVLEKPYRKILGTVDPATNDGSTVTQVALPGAAGNNLVGEALFLIDYDYIAPGTITDLNTQ